MRNFLLLVMGMMISCGVFAQSFEVTSLQDSYKGYIGEAIKAPIRFKNTSDKAITLIIRNVDAQIGSSQKNYFCLDNNCLDHKVEDFIVKIEAGQILNTFQIVLEAGLVSGESSLHYIAFNKFNPGHSVEFDLNFVVEEKPEKQNIYS